MIFSDKYELIKKLARDFAEKEIPNEVQEKIDQTGEYLRKSLRDEKERFIRYKGP